MARTYESTVEQVLYDELTKLHLKYLNARLALMHSANELGISTSIIRDIGRQVLVDSASPENRARVAKIMSEFDLAEPQERS